MKSIVRSICIAGLLTVNIAGCSTTSGARSSIWPTKPVSDPTRIGSDTSSKNSLTNGLSSTTKTVKNGFSTVGTVFTSAYGKAKTAVTTPFSANDGKTASLTADDPLSLTAKGAESIAPEVMVFQGQMYEQQGQFAKATDLYSKALETEPKNVAATTAMARLNDRQNDSPKAIEFYKKAIDLSPGQASIHGELASVYSRSSQSSLAKEEYKKAIALDPANKTWRSNMAGLLIDEGQSELAYQEICQVEKPAMAQYQMAYLQASKQNLPAAKQHLNSALEIDPNLKPARDMLGSLNANHYIDQANGIAHQAAQLTNQVQQSFATPVSYSRTP